MAQGEVSGSGALRLSTLIAKDLANAEYRGALQVHFAPDIGGVEELKQKLMETADPNAHVLKSSCPLVHQEIDYDNYDLETGDFKSAQFPLVPDGLWHNLCQKSGIKASKLKWKDLPPSSIQRLARLLVDCSIHITGIRPHEKATAGGVNMKEVDISGGCMSRIRRGLFVCGSVMDVHGYDGGFNALASLATGRVAGLNAVQMMLERCRSDA